MSATPVRKSVLITGANRGMGLAYARHYLDGGWRVVATARSPETADDLRALQPTWGDALRISPLNVADDESVARLATHLQRQEASFDLVIGNAGVSSEEPFGEWTAACFMHQLRVNAIGPAILAQALAPLMRRGSAWVNVTSGMGSLELNINPDGPLAAYATSKAALNQLTLRLAVILKPRGVTVVAINPGWVQTEMGGPQAPTSVESAVAQIAATIESLTPEHSGQLFNDNGERLPF